MTPLPGQLQFALRQAAICALTALIVEYFQTPDPALSVYVVFFLNRMDRTSSLLLNCVLLLLMTLIICVVMPITMFVLDEPVLRVVSITLVSFGFLFLMSASKLRALGAIIALIIGFALDLLGRVPAGELATRALLYSWLFVATPVSVSVVVNLLLAPSPRQMIEATLSHHLRLGSASLRSAGTRTRIALERCVERGLGEVPAWLKLAVMERTSPASEITALANAAHSTMAILLLLDLAAREAQASLSGPVRGHIASVLEKMATTLETGTCPIEIQLDRFAEEDSMPAVALALLANLRAMLRNFTETTSIPTAAAPTSGEAGFFRADILSNPEHVRFALKTTGAAMFCFALYNLLDWPSIHTCFITCYIVALSTTAETVEKLKLRIIGCLLGAAAGIATLVFIAPSLDSIGMLMGVIFAGGFAAAWIAGGSPRIAYAGFQMAFAFFLCVIQGPTPAFDMVTARDRVIGILIGNLVSYFVFVNIWPVSISRRIDPAIEGILRSLKQLSVATRLTANRSLAAQAMVACGGVGADLQLIAHEPPALRPPPGWIDGRSLVLRELAALAGPLLLASEESSRSNGAASVRLSHLLQVFDLNAEPVDESSVVAARNIATPVQVGMTAAWRMVDEHLQTLETVIAVGAIAQGTFGHDQA